MRLVLVLRWLGTPKTISVAVRGARRSCEHDRGVGDYVADSNHVGPNFCFRWIRNCRKSFSILSCSFMSCAASEN